MGNWCLPSLGGHQRCMTGGAVRQWPAGNRMLGQPPALLHAAWQQWKCWDFRRWHFHHQWSQF